MKIGYPCINTSVECRGNRTFRLASYSEENLVATAGANIECLKSILDYNIAHGMLFFRISSDIIPFASHPVMDTDWQDQFRKDLKEAGEIVRTSGMRISMHPDQFIVLNSPREEVVSRSIAELEYHADLLDLMHLDASAKIQLHAGGRYGDPESAKNRFVSVYRERLTEKVKKRLVIENDDRNYPVQDCLDISEKTGVPVLFDYFHHRLLSHAEDFPGLLEKTFATWHGSHGIPMVDYSSQEQGMRRGTHARTLDRQDFIDFVKKSGNYDFDIMLEIKDKEKSAERALGILRGDPRLVSRRMQ
jgi:UV DNA damage endonuclease